MWQSWNRNLDKSWWWTTIISSQWFQLCSKWFSAKRLHSVSIYGHDWALGVFLCGGLMYFEILSYAFFPSAIQQSLEMFGPCRYTWHSWSQVWIGSKTFWGITGDITGMLRQFYIDFIWVFPTSCNAISCKTFFFWIQNQHILSRLNAYLIMPIIIFSVELGDVQTYKTFCLDRYINEVSFIKGKF